MAKHKLTAGAEIDLLTKDEVRDVLRSWMEEITRGARYIRRAVTGTVDGGGALLIGGVSDEDTLKPPPGFMWAVTRISLSGLTAGQSVDVYINEVAPSQLLYSNVTNGTRVPTTRTSIVMQGNDHLIVRGTALTAAAQIGLNLGIKEVPAFMAWSL